jgi:uncharacterized protein YceH (UPF0502 family)
MKWLGWICCVLLLGLVGGLNVSGSKKLRAQKAYLQGFEERTAKEESNILTTRQNKTAALAKALADKEAKVTAARKDIAELEEKHVPLNERVAELTKRRMASGDIRRPSQFEENAPTRPVAGNVATSPAPASAASQARIAELEAEIGQLRRKVNSVSLR